MVLLGNDKFLSELSRLFILARNSGPINLVVKRYDGRDRHFPKDGSKPLPDPEEYMCKIRVVHKKQKITTVVKATEVEKFQSTYCSLLRSNMDGLKKIKKPKSKPKAAQ